MEIEELIRLSRVRILSDTEQEIKIEYNGSEETIMHHSSSHLIPLNGNGSIMPQQRLELSLTQLVIEGGVVFQDRSAPPEFKEVMIFHELREKEYKKFMIDDAHDRAVNDELLYVIKFFDPDSRQKYLDFAELYRQGGYTEQDKNRTCNAHWWGEAYKNLPDKQGINLIVEMFNGRRDSLCPRIIELGYKSGGAGGYSSFWIDLALMNCNLLNSTRDIKKAHILLCADSDEPLNRGYPPNVTLIDGRDKSNFTIYRYLKWYEQDVSKRIKELKSLGQE